ncbi:hypothetical protein C8F04DRAFT_954354 [Mycena alexandri]|uniref:Uncharacterized protein n=1 Tax=Mycena alexandri TaxID=1745969 RepID=A0AAD6X8I5_9AGAR|nr:hypothetical protein C8F04DRAFT_954354 [Mycena alexandri]
MTDGVPNWAGSAKEALEEGAGSDEWSAVVGAWWDIERTATFTGPAKGRSVGLRPKEVTKWIGRGRIGGAEPPLTDLYGFAAGWWKFWTVLNPAWRVEKRGVGERLAKSADGELGPTVQTGPNGILNVLICLRWWRDKIDGAKEVAAWDEAVEDVRWALQKHM